MFLSSLTLTLLVAATAWANPIPPPSNSAGSPNTQCTLQSTPTMSQLKSVACLVEAMLLEPMKNPDIPSFDMFRPENQPNSGPYSTQLQSCSCQTPSRNTSIYKSQPIYGIDPHITVRQLYDPRITNVASLPYPYQQYLPENIVNDNGQASAVNTEWILQDHINSLKAFVGYLIPAKPVSGGDELAKIAMSLNETVLPILAFPFSNQCPSDQRSVAFSGFPSQECELKCAAWHFNWTLYGLYYALGNQGIYPPSPPVPANANDPYPELEQWRSMDCCSAEPLHPLTHYEYRNLSCAVGTLSFVAYELFDALGTQKSTQCSGVSTVTGIKTWTDYVSTNRFPPLTWSNSRDLFIYGNHFSAFEKHYNDLQKLLNSLDAECYQSDQTGQLLQKLVHLFEFISPITQQWMLSHNCPACSSCADPSATPPNATPINTQVACPDSYRQVSCLALDIQKVAESAYLYLDMRTEATPTWDTACSEFWYSQ